MMARQNIFEKLKSCWSPSDDIERIYNLVRTTNLIETPARRYSLGSFVDYYCFEDWKNRGHFLDLDDFLETVEYDNIYEEASNTFENLLEFIEISYNLFQLASTKLDKEPKFEIYSDFTLLQTIMNDCLAHYNYCAYYDKEKEQVLVLENDSAATAVVEIEDDKDIAFDIIRYNHYTLKGDISQKKGILLKLGAQLEPQRDDLAKMNKPLSQNIFSMLNNLNIRHNNCTPDTPKYKPSIAAMSPEEFESWYDELYQMILLAKLELDNIGRSKQVAELIAKL